MSFLHKKCGDFYLFGAKYVAIFLLLMLRSTLIAQDFELITIQSAYYPKQTIRESTVEGEIGVLEWGVLVALPQSLKKDKKTILIHKIGYGNLTVNTEINLPTASVKSERYYHSISYNLGLIQSLGSNWLLAVNFIPTLASDFLQDLSSDDLLLQANAIAVKTKNEKLKYGFGLAYTTRFGREVVIPTGMLKYTTSKLSVDIVFPNRLNFMFKRPKNQFLYGIKAGLNGGLFNNTSEIQTINNTVEKVGYSRAIIGPAITFRLKKAININFLGGITLNRRVDFIDKNDEVIDRTPLTGPFIGMGISLAPTLKNSGASLQY